MKRPGTKYSIQDDAKEVNRLRVFANGENKYYTNCTLCSIVYDMRRRGCDVNALPATPKSDKIFKDVYKDLKIESVTDKSMYKTKLTKSIVDKCGEGSRGFMLMTWYGSDGQAGHAVNWEVKNGKFVLVDSQIGKVHSGFSANSKYLYYAESNIMWARTDNLEMNEEAITKKKICQ